MATLQKITQPLVIEKYPFLTSLIELAQKHLLVKKIYLFGSRARGDFHEHSDFDIAFSFQGQANTPWPRFCANWEDSKKTLHSFDLIDMNGADKKLIEKIQSEGIIIYG